MARTNSAKLVKYGIVNARNTDGYSIINEYSDGSQSSPWGWFESFEAAERALENTDEPIEDWTTDDTAE